MVAFWSDAVFSGLQELEYSWFVFDVTCLLMQNF